MDQTLSVSTKPVRKPNLYAIPDIHGRLDLLTQLWETLETAHSLDLTKDKVIFLGDMIDRGADSKGVLDFVKEKLEKHPGHVVALDGNHEWLAINASMKGYDDYYLWMMNGGEQTLKSFAVDAVEGMKKMPDDYVKWLASLPLKHEEPGFFFSHAPAPRESYRLVINRDQEFTKEELTWTYHRDEFGIARNHGNGVIGVCGHVHALRKGVKAPRFYDHYIYADAGCGCHPEAPLVAIEVNTQQVIYAWPAEAMGTRS
jgi:hypothetical protein